MSSNLVVPACLQNNLCAIVLLPHAALSGTIHGTTFIPVGSLVPAGGRPCFVATGVPLLWQSHIDG